MRWKLLGLLPLVHADGPEVTRSAVGRAAAEAVWVPTALLPRFGVDWSAADPGHITARYRIDTVKVEITAYATFDGLSIPSAGRFGWFFGTDRWSQGEFFRYQITQLQFMTKQ